MDRSVDILQRVEPLLALSSTPPQRATLYAHLEALLAEQGGDGCAEGRTEMATALLAVRQDIKRLFALMLPEPKVEKVDGVIVPPDEVERKIAKSVSKGKVFISPRQLIPRYQYLKEVLAQLGVNLKDVKVREGIVDKNMVRKQSYRMVRIPQLQRTVLVCDEEGNATFVLPNIPEDIEIVQGSKKTQLKDMARHNESAVVYWKNKDVESWKKRMSKLLTKWPKDDLPHVGEDGILVIRDEDEGSEIQYVTVYKLGSEFDADRHSIKNLLEESDDVPSVFGRNLQNHVNKFYSYEDAKRVLGEYVKLPKCDDKGLVMANGKSHYLMHTLARLMGVTPIFLKDVITSHKVTFVFGRGKGAGMGKFYCEEEVRNILDTQLPKCGSDNTYSGKDGKQYAAKTAFEAATGMSQRTIYDRIKGKWDSVKHIPGRVYTGQRATLYDVDEVKRLVC